MAFKNPVIKYQINPVMGIAKSDPLLPGFKAKAATQF
jgi:hypothetical protein